MLRQILTVVGAVPTQFLQDPVRVRFPEQSEETITQFFLLLLVGKTLHQVFAIRLELLDEGVHSIAFHALPQRGDKIRGQVFPARRRLEEFFVEQGHYGLVFQLLEQFDVKWGQDRALRQLAFNGQSYHGSEALFTTSAVEPIFWHVPTHSQIGQPLRLAAKAPDFLLPGAGRTGMLQLKGIAPQCLI